MINKYSYFNGGKFYEDEQDPWTNNFYQPGGTPNNEKDINMDRFENQQRDGKDFKEFDKFKKKKRLKRLLLLKRINELLKQMKEEDNEDADTPPLQPAPFYEELYGYKGFEGAYTSPLEYYSGSISEEPGNVVSNPYNYTYQPAMASSRMERMKIRAMIFNDFGKIAISKDKLSSDMYNELVHIYEHERTGYVGISSDFIPRKILHSLLLRKLIKPVFGGEMYRLTDKGRKAIGQI